MQALDPHIAARLKEAAGPGGASEDPHDLAPLLEEFRGRWKGTTPLLLRPTTTEQVSRILGVCFETGTPVVPQGGNTGMVGGQIPTRGEVLLSVTRMNRIRSVSQNDNALVAEAGVILAEVQRAADAAGRLFPLSLGAEGSCTIGGNLSTNAGGVAVLRYGMSRELVLGLEVVLADGRVLDLMRGLRKDNTGYDLKQLFIGAEGTLGIITAAMLKLFPRPAGYATVFAALPSLEAAVPLLNRLQNATGGLVTAFEIIPGAAMELVLHHIPGTANPLPDHYGWTVLIEVSSPSAFDATQTLTDALGQAMGDGLVADAAFAKNARERQALWRLRETIPEAQKKDGPSISNDISVRMSQIPAFVAAAETAIAKVLPGARSFAFGHAGDGNLHLAVRAPEGRGHELPALRDRIEGAVNDTLEAFGGSISAEHGLGLAKNETIARYKSAAEIETMRALKRALDPKNILNPGKLLPPDS
jgi:FAD/FMN-containing dehydrogenase